MTKKTVGSSQEDTVKQLEDYRNERPMQLNFFELLGIENKSYSRTIELYDFIPKYYWGKVERIKIEKTGQEILPLLEREFECRGKRYQVTITPAIIKNKQKKERYYYPGPREEAVEDALRKLAVEGRGKFLDDQAGVIFTLHELQQELKRTGHTYNKDELKEALQICKRTNLTVTSEDGSAILESSIFETLGLATFEDWKTKGRDAKCFVRFNALVTRAIQQFDIRRFNYEKAWSYKSVIARQLHKRLSHHYTQASGNNSYSIQLTTMLRDFGLARCPQLRDNLKRIQQALEEMREKGVLDKYKIEPIVDAKRHNKLEDAKLTFWTTYEFDMEVIESNRERQRSPVSPSRGPSPRR